MSIAVGILLFVIAAFCFAILVRAAEELGEGLVLFGLGGANIAAGVMNIVSESDAWQIGVGVWVCILAVCAFVGLILATGNRLSEGRHDGAPGWVIGGLFLLTGLFTTFGVLQLTLVA